MAPPVPTPMMCQDSLARPPLRKQEGSGDSTVALCTEDFQHV